MLNGYKSKPFNECLKNDNIYQFIVEKNYNSFWKYHETNNTKFLENGYNKFNNNKYIKKLFEQMFEFNPTKRIKIQEIEKHEWVTHMHNHQWFQNEFVYNGELQTLYQNSRRDVETSMNHERKDNANAQSAGAATASNSCTSVSNNNISIAHSSTLPQNESKSVDISTLSELLTSQLEASGISGIIAYMNSE